MVNPVDIVVPIILAIIILGVSFYLFTMYCHPEQKGFGVQVFPKVLVVISQALAWGQILLLPLDLSISISNPETNFSLIYFIIYPIIFVFVAFLNPFAIFFYESDENDSLLSRICWSILYSTAIAVIWCVGVFVSYVWVSPYNFQGQSYQLSIPMYIFLIMTLIGWILLALNGGVGLVYLPNDLIQYFVLRPKKLTAEQALSKKQLLQTTSSDMIGLGQKLKDMQLDLKKQNGSWFSKKINQSKFLTKIDEYKRQVIQLQQDYELFDNQVKHQSRHPIVYIVSLIGGILASIGTLAWFIQIIGTVFEQNNHYLFLFIDEWLNSLAQGNASFVSTIIYGLMTLYLQVCLVKGNTIFGLRIPFILNFHPMKINKTYMNSLLFNSNLMLLASVSTSILSVWAFPTYLFPTYLSQTTRMAFNNQIIFNVLYQKRIPMCIIEAIVLAALIVIISKLIYRKCKQKNSQKQNQIK